MRIRSGLIALVLLLGVAAPAVADCINPAPSGYVSHRTVFGTPYDVRARTDDAAKADALTRRLVLTDPWIDLHRLFSLGADTDVSPPLTNGVYPVLIEPRCGRVPCLSGTIVGYQNGLCDPNSGHTGIVVLNRASVDYILETMSHELFHAFQSAAARELIEEGWWVEATAEWGDTIIWGYDVSSPSRDTRFFNHPELPIDETRHAYGAWRFVEWTQQHLYPNPTDEAALWHMLVASFRRMGSQTLGSTSQAVALSRAWSGFHQALGKFWFDHLNPVPNNGPAAHAPTWNVGAGGRSQTFRMAKLSARLLKIRLRPAVQRVTVKVHAIRGEHQLWVRDETAHRVHGRTYERTWCRDAFPANFAVADTNTAQRRASLRVQVMPRSGTGCSPPPPATCSRAVAGAAQTCTPPPATGASCDSARAGVYRNEAPDAYGLYAPPYVTFDLICAPDGLELNGFGGLLSDDNCHNVNLGPSGGTYRVGRMLNPDGSVDFSYAYNDHQVTGHLSAAGEGAQGTVSVTTPTCHIDYPFGAVWYE